MTIVLLVMVCGGLATAELLVRYFPPRPVQQVVRQPDLYTVDDIPIWHMTGETLHHENCATEHPERTRVIIVGDSIFAGSMVDRREVFSLALEKHLNEILPKPGFCIMNFSEPGFHFDQKYVITKEAIEKYHPALVVLEDWDTDTIPYVRLNDAAFGVHDWKLRPDGYPGLPGVPDALNRWLFRHSRLYEYFDVATNPRNAPASEREAKFYASKFPRLINVVKETHTPMVMFLASPLDRPFKDILSGKHGPGELSIGWQTPFQEAARAAGIPVYPLQAEFANEDYQAMRIDPICHFSVAGHKVLARIVERVILEQLKLQPAH